MDPWTDNAKNLTEVAIVYPKNDRNIRDQASCDRQLRATVRMLCELRQQFDVVTDFSDWNKYNVLVIPDDIVFTDEIARRIKAHIAAGKAVIASGSSGVDPEKGKFVLETEQPGRRMVHILSYIPEMRGSKQIIEEPLQLNDVEISLRYHCKLKVRLQGKYIWLLKKNLYHLMSIMDI